MHQTRIKPVSNPELCPYDLVTTLFFISAIYTTIIKTAARDADIIYIHDILFFAA